MNSKESSETALPSVDIFESLASQWVKKAKEIAAVKLHINGETFWSSKALAGTDQSYWLSI